MLGVGSVVGILGGGQLARMLAIAASRIGYRSHIYDPDASSPAFDVSSFKTVGSFKNKKLLQKFAQSVDVVTYEFENIPESALEEIEKFVHIFPKKNALSISQDRIQEKLFFKSLDLQTVEYESVQSITDFLEAIKKIKIPAILKTCREGYDGKGQLMIDYYTKEMHVKEHLLNGPCVLESFLNFDKELSVIIARNEIGDVVSFDPGENIHKSGILHSTTVPSQTPKSLQLDAILVAGKIVNALDYVGVLGVELFIKQNKEIIVNEIAPRVHNSGHWTQNGCTVDQFEQHLRAICGRVLGDGERYANVTMINIIGTQINRSLNISSAATHLYGKKEARAGRKMGHINHVTTLTTK